MNILVVYRECDVPTYAMLAELSKKENYTVFLAVDNKQRVAHLDIGRCHICCIPSITSKFNLSAIKSIRHLILKNQIDVVFSPGSSGLSNSLFASLFTQAKNLAYRGTQAKVRKTDPTYYLGILNPRISHVVCETEDIKDYLSHFISNEKLSVAVKPYEVSWVSDACQNPLIPENIPSNAFKCIYIGVTKNRPFKGLSYLVEAFHCLNSPDVHLTIIGDYDQDVYNRAMESCYADHIHFLGSRPDAVNFLPSHDLFILPSIRDASPRVVREAMACGVPCIVTDIPGARDLIEDGISGLLVPPASAEAIATHIGNLMSNKERLSALSAASRERIIKKYALIDYTHQFGLIFDKLRNKIIKK